MVPLGTRTGTGVSTGAGVGSDGGGGASGGRSGRGGGGGGGGGGASRFALPRSAMEVASPTLSDEEGVPRCAPGEQRQHPGGVLSQMTQQSTLYDEEQSVTSPVNDSQVSLCNNTSKIV
ncbi:hypothetical protein BGZ73_007418 [Actinomortierella ambigua]|nr:hypothetical protein BGZ73_007418 [Actinomortierella ambigua]